MKTIIKNAGTITKVLMVALIITGVSVDTYAQKKKKEKELKRPEKVGHASTDDFVSSAFNLYEKNQEITKKLSDAAGNITDAGKIKDQLDGQMKEVTGLLGKSADVVKGAKSITPKTDSMKAVKAVNTATKALNKTKENIPGQLEQIKSQKKD
jgi:hypothetical protein